MKKISIGLGIGFCGLLGIVFITLKLCHVIEWAWIWVLAPLWGPFALWILAVIVYLVVELILDGINSLHNKRQAVKLSKKDEDSGLKKQVKAWKTIVKYGYQLATIEDDEAYTKNCTHLMIRIEIPNRKIYEKRKLEKAIETLFGELGPEENK